MHSSSLPPHRQRIVRGFIVLTMFLLVGSITAVLLAQRPSLTTPSVRRTSPPQATATPLRLSPLTHLSALTMISPTEGWAIGNGGTTGTDDQALLLRYHDGAWQALPLSASGNEFHALAMISPTEGWMGGMRQVRDPSQGVLLHYLQGQLSTVALPPGVGDITGIAMVSPTEGWAVTTTSSPQGYPQILHFAQGQWQVALTVTSNAAFTSITMVSPTEGWATGVGAGTSNLWHYTQGKWQHVLLADPQRADLEYLSMLSADEGWGIGTYSVSSSKSDQVPHTAGALWHYSQGAWQVVSRYTDEHGQTVHLAAIQAINTGDVWVSETDSTGRRFLHMTAGEWQTVDAPIRDGITSISFLSAREGWAVGDAGQILHFRQGQWTDYPTSG